METNKTNVRKQVGLTILAMLLFKSPVIRVTSEAHTSDGLFCGLAYGIYPDGNANIMVTDGRGHLALVRTNEYRLARFIVAVQATTNPIEIVHHLDITHSIGDGRAAQPPIINKSHVVDFHDILEEFEPAQV